MVTSERIQKFVFTSSLTEKSNSLVSDGRCTQNTSSHAHLSQSCQSSQRDALYMHIRACGSRANWAQVFCARSQKRHLHHHATTPLCVPSISSLFCSIPPPNLDPDSFDADWNQNTTKRDSAVGWAVWSSGRPHSMHRNFRTQVGLLLFLSVLRPDLQYAVGQFATHASAPTVSDRIALKRLILLLSATRNMTLDLFSKYRLVLTAVVHADWAGIAERRSATGGVVLLAGCCVASWSPIQASYALSSCPPWPVQQLNCWEYTR